MISSYLAGMGCKWGCSCWTSFARSNGQQNLHNTLGPHHRHPNTPCFWAFFPTQPFLRIPSLSHLESLKVIGLPKIQKKFPSAEAFTQSFQSSRLSVISWHKSGHRSEEYCWIAYTSPRRIEQSSHLSHLSGALFRKTCGVSGLEVQYFRLPSTWKPITWLLHAASKIQLNVLQQNQTGSTYSWFLQHCSAKGAKSRIFSVKKSLSGFGGRPLMSSSPTPLARRLWGRHTAVVSPCLDFTCKIETWKEL